MQETTPPLHALTMGIPHPDSTIDMDNTHANASLANPDPFKYSHGLTGTNQRANFFFAGILVATVLLPLVVAVCFRAAKNLRSEHRRVAFTNPHADLEAWRHERSRRWGRGFVKRHILYASAPSTPLTPPIGLAHFLLLTLYIASNTACMLSVTRTSRAQALAELRARAGSLAALNLVLTALCALRNNPLTHLAGTSQNTLNFFHRGIARLVVLQCGVHVGAFAANAHAVSYRGREGWESVVWVVQRSRSYQWGVLGAAAFVVLAAQSVRAVRAAGYDVFVVVHRVAAGVAVVGLYGHLAEHRLPQLPWVYVVMGVLGVEVLVRFGRAVWFNASWRRRRWTTLSIEALPDDATRVSIRVPRVCTVRPGSHIYLYIPRLSVWTSHPFSVAWSEANDTPTFTSDKALLDVTTESSSTSTTLTCLIRARDGVTRALYEAASLKAHSKRLWCAVEGPYSSPCSLDSYGTVVLFAAGVGITHTVPFVKHLLAGHAAGTVAARRVVLVWCIRHVGAIEWIRPWLEDLERMSGYYEVVRVQVYVSGVAPPMAQARGLAGVEVKAGRCVPEEVLQGEVLGQVGAMGVVVCGPEGFVGSVREAVRQQVGSSWIDFWEESAC